MTEPEAGAGTGLEGLPPETEALLRDLIPEEAFARIRLAEDPVAELRAEVALRRGQLGRLVEVARGIGGLGLPFDVPAADLPAGWELGKGPGLQAGELVGNLADRKAQVEATAPELTPTQARERLGMPEEVFAQAWPAFYRATATFPKDGDTAGYGIRPREDPGAITYLASPEGRPYLAVFREPWEILELTEAGPYGAAMLTAATAAAAMIATFVEWGRAGQPESMGAELAQAGTAAAKARAALLEELRRLYRPSMAPIKAPAIIPLAPQPPKRGRRMAEAIPQPTFIEARELSRSFANAPSLRYWSPLAGETAMLHKSPGAAHTAKLAFSADLAAWWGLTPSTDALQALLQRFGPDGYLAVHLVVGLSLEAERVTVTLDDLILAIGWDPRSEHQRRTMRREWWLYLTTMASTAMIGARAGHEKYRDRRTGREIDTVIRSPLVVILGDEKNAQLSLDVSEPPLSVTLTAGIFTAAHRGNQQVLSEHGDLLRLAKIPAGKAAGRWARSIGVALHQKWRERGKETSGDRYTFTRRELLDLYRVDPYYDELMQGINPGRVITYWRDALGLLEKQAVLGKREEPALPDSRKGQVEAFLDQRVTIWPPASLLTAATEIQEHAQAASRRRGGRPRKAKPTPH